MPTLIDVTGQRFGRLTVLSVVRQASGKSPLCTCLCECGATKAIEQRHLRAGVVVSCGCFGKEQTRKANTKHGAVGSPTYRSWQNMRDRCENPSSNEWHNYGGRGIRVHPSWQRFEAFVADMGIRPTGTSIDRIDVDGNYEPGKCRWATQKEQALNRRKNVRISLNGKSLTAGEWAEITGINVRTIRVRLQRGWTAERALTERPELNIHPAQCIRGHAFTDANTHVGRDGRRCRECNRMRYHRRQQESIARRQA